MSDQVKAIFEFWAENPSELSFQVGDILTVIKRDDRGWWEGSLNGKKGLFPSNYVEPYTASAAPNRALPPGPLNTKPPAGNLPTFPAAYNNGGANGGAAGNKFNPPKPAGAAPPARPADWKPLLNNNNSNGGASSPNATATSSSSTSSPPPKPLLAKPAGEWAKANAGSTAVGVPNKPIAPNQYNTPSTMNGSASPPNKASRSPAAPPAIGSPSQGAIPENKPTVFNPDLVTIAPPNMTLTQPLPAGERKPAGQVKGGGGDAEKDVIRESKTKFGLWASNIAYYTGFIMIPMGLLSILWNRVDDRNHDLPFFWAGIYSSALGFGIIWFESNYGNCRGESRVPLRGLGYLCFSIPMFFSLATFFCGFFLLLTFVVNCVATVMDEVYDPPKSRGHAGQASDLVPTDSFFEGMTAWMVMIKQQNKSGAIIFMLVYALANILLFAVTVNKWVEKIAGLPPPLRLSDWAPWAKGFGALLDLNCAIIVLPVSRTLLRMLYNRSTADQGCISKTLRAILAYIPLDQNILFHKIIARVILFSAMGHIGFHFTNLAFAYSNTLDLFGTSAWITGGFIVFWMMILYSATPDNTKRGQFEIFWYSHHVFILFFIFILFHGNGGINPNYWKYAIPTMTIYIIERILRVYRASLPVSVLSISLMDDVLSLEFAKEGSVFEFEHYKEGQYLFLQSPPISKIQWHPFTISSAPQESSVTVHIRVCGEGSWTRGLMQYCSAMGIPGKSLIQLDRLGPDGKTPGKILGPDGNKIILIDGPHSAPTQHMGEYSTCMIVGAGIGATPVSSTLKSVVFHKWRLNIGECFPDNAYFMWVCAHRDIDAFRWLIRTIKEAQDEVVHLRSHSAAAMSSKTFEVHIFLTSAPKNPKPVEVVVDDEIGFWGPPREKTNIEKARAGWNEIDLYKAMKCPKGHIQFGDVHIWEGRPKWDARFKDVAQRHQTEVGVAFCGNPMIAKDLRKQCYLTNKTRSQAQGLFRLHKENF